MNSNEQQIPGAPPGGLANQPTARNPVQTQLRSSEVQALRGPIRSNPTRSAPNRSPRAEKVNVNNVERAISSALGALLLGTAAKDRPLLAISKGLLGAAFLYRGLSGHCHVYQALELNSTGKSKTHRSGTMASTIVQRTVTIDKPADELYSLWRDSQTLRHVMDFFAEVESTTDRDTHWKVRAPLGQVFEWDSRNIEERPGESLRWESTEGSTFRSTGSISFAPGTYGRGTVVTLTFGFDPPGGRLGQAAAKLLRVVPSTLAFKALQRFKSLAETGEIATAVRNPSEIERHPREPNAMRADLHRTRATHRATSLTRGKR